MHSTSRYARAIIRQLQTACDCQALIEYAKSARRVVVIEESFIGLEVTAALRARELEVHVVAPEHGRWSEILGPQMGEFVAACTRSTASTSTSKKQ